VGRAIHQCQTLKQIDLGDLSQTWLISIFRYGLTNHLSVQGLSLGNLDLSAWTAAVAVVFRQVLRSSTPIQTLNLDPADEPPHGFIQDILEGLCGHPTIKSLLIKSCMCYDIGAVEALEEVLGPSDPNVETFVLSNLDLTGFNVPFEGTLIEKILRNNRQMASLSLSRIAFENEGAILFLKTAIQAPSLTRLDIDSWDFRDTVFESLASWSSHHGKKSMLQTLHVTENPLGNNRGLQHLITVLRRHTPQLRNLIFKCFNFDDDAMIWAKSLQTLPLEKISFINCNLHEEST
jgi:hypothetical protein